MKRGIIYICLCSIVLLLVIILSERRGDLEITAPTPTSVPMLTEPEYSEEDEREYTVVIDAAEKERRLYLGEVDAKKEREGEFGLSNPTAVYSQVERDHYYFMRSNGKRQYTIFRDKGEVVGKFKVQHGYVDGFIKYGSQFYVRWVNDPRKGKRESRLAEVDLEAGGIKFIADMDFFASDQDEFFYKNHLYIYKGKDLKVFDLKRKCYEKEIETTGYFQRGFKKFIDGKFYYGVCQVHKVKLFSFDPKTETEEEILYFEHKDDLGEDGVSLSMDDKNIYCENYVIPRQGGRMRKMKRDLRKGGNVWFYEIMYLFNWGDNLKKYLFYLDDDYKVHRIDRKTGKDRIITKMDVMDVAWTNQNVYIQAYEEEIMDYNDDDQGSIYQTKDDDTSCDLYCMDLDGKNIEKIAD